MACNHLQLMQHLLQQIWGWWLNQPLWENHSQIGLGSSFPNRDRGEHKTYLSRHHLDLLSHPQLFIPGSFNNYTFYCFFQLDDWIMNQIISWNKKPCFTISIHFKTWLSRSSRYSSESPPHLTFHPGVTRIGRIRYRRHRAKCWRNRFLEDPIPPGALLKKKGDPETVVWLVVSTHLKHISQIGNLPQGSGWK